MNNFGNNSYLAHGMKYFILFLLVLIGGGGIVLLMASGNYGPKADAEAQRVQAQTRTQEARDAIDTKTYAQQQAIALELESKLNALQVEQQKRLNEQELEQRQDAYARWQMLLETGMWIVATGAELAFVIAASAFAYKLFEQARAVRQEAKWIAEARALQSQILKLERQFQKQQTQLYGMEQEAQAVDGRELMKRLAEVEANLNSLHMWRLEHSNNGGHAFKGPSRGDSRNLPKAA